MLEYPCDDWDRHRAANDEVVQVMTADAVLTGTITRLEGNAIVIGKDSLFINSADVSLVKLYDEVEYEKEGPNLKNVRKKPSAPAQQLKEGQTVLKEVHLEAQRPYVLLTGERGEFSKSVEKEAFDQVKNVQPGKFIRYSTNKEAQGTPIKSFWEVDAEGKSLNKTNNNQNWKPKKTLTIGGTINLENFENLKIEISGPFNSIEDAKKLQQDFREVAYLFRGDMVTKRSDREVCHKGLWRI